jgi:hypothetical protein
MSGGAGGSSASCTPSLGAFSGGVGGTSLTTPSSGAGGGGAGSGSVGGAASGTTAGSAGTGTYVGGAGAAGVTSGNGVGTNATALSGGGSGARAGSGSTNARVGGNGAAGKVILTYSLPACSGTPAPGNTVASVNPVAGGSATVLSLQNTTTGTGVTYQWQSSADNSTWNNISLATNATYSATPTASTYYRCNVTCSGSTGTSAALQVNLRYCTPVATGTGTYISNFVTTGGTANISNNSNAFATNGYIDYSSTISASQFATASLSFSVTIVGGTAGIAIWVDWNKNFVFDAGEVVYTSNAYRATGTTSSSFTIPSGTALGNYRMRVVTDFNAQNPTTCFTAATAEAEDYTLTVVAQPPTLTVGTLTAFGNICVGSSSPQVAGSYYRFFVKGVSMTNAGNIEALAGYTYSLTPVNGYASTLSLPLNGSALDSVTIYVKFTPTAVQSYSGNIVVSSTGATSKNVAASATGITVPTITAEPSTAGQTLNQNQATGISALSVTATGTGTLSYRWFVNSTGSTDTTASTFVTGATAATYTPSSATTGTFYYFCSVTNTCGATVSNASGAIFVTSCPAAATPLEQATSLSFNSFTDSMRVNFVAASGADGYLVVRYPASTTTPDNPATNTTYTAGSVFGTGGRVVYFGAATTFRDNFTITANTTYNYFVFAYNGAVCGNTSYNTTSPLTASSSTCVTVPTASAATSIAGTSFTANWSLVTGATGYVLDVSTVNTFASFVSGYNGLAISGGSTNSYAVTGLSPVTTHYYRVRAVNSGASCTTFNSSTITATTTCTTAPLPYTQNFESVSAGTIPTCTQVVQAGSGNLWNTLSAPGAGFTSMTLGYTYNISNAANTWYFIHGLNLTAGVSYTLTYRYGSKSTSSFAEKLKVAFGTSATAAAMTTILADHPNILSGAALSNIVYFKPTTSGVYYIGFQAYSIANMNVLHLDDITVETTPPAIATGTLSAFGNICTGATSAASSFTLSGRALTNDVNIGSLSGYTYSSSLAGVYDTTLTVAKVGDSLPANTLVYVKFSPTAAQSYSGNIVVSSTGAVSKNVAASGTGITVPTITVQPSTAGQTLLQNAVTGINTISITVTGTGTLSYRWFVNNTGINDTTASTFISGATSASYVPPTSTAGTFYYFCSVKNTCGSTVSNASGAIVISSCPASTAPVNQPTSLSFTSFTDSIRINFVASSGTDGYLVVRYPSGTTTPDNPTDNATYTAGSVFGTSGRVVYFGSATTFRDNFTLTANTSYEYFVIAYNGAVCGNTSYYTTSPLTATGTTCVAIPTTSAATAITESGFTANWTAVAGATGYILDVSTSSTFASFVAGYNGLAVSGGSTASYNVTGLSKVTTYYYRVRAVNETISCTTGNSSTITTTTYQSIPWTEGFIASGTPAGWNLSGLTSGSVGVLSGLSGNPGNAVVGILSGTYTSQSFITPSFANVPTNSFFSFDYRVSNSSGADITTWNGNYKFQISTDGTTYVDLTSASSAVTTGGYVRVSVAIPNTYAGNRIVLRCLLTRTSGTSYFGFDNFQIKATCTTPASPTSYFGVAGPGTNAISFTANGTRPDNYLVVRYPAGATNVVAPTNVTSYTVGTIMGDGIVSNVVSGSATSCIAAGLSPTTSYDFYIYPYNGSSCLSGPIYGLPLVGTTTTSGCPTLNANITIGASGADFITLTDASAILNGCPVSEPTLVKLNADYDPALESYPIIFYNNSGASSTNTITIQPSSDAVSFTLNGTTTSPIIDLSGAKYYILDGRAGGVGSSILNITNSGNGPAIRLASNAQNDTIRYVNLKSSNTSATSGVVYFGTAVGSSSAAGNSNNAIENCNINANSVSPIGIYATGSAAPADNKSNTIANNNIYDYFSDVAAIRNTGIQISTGNAITTGSAWTISGNSFYQTATRTYTTAVSAYHAINADGSDGVFNISNNYIGGTASALGSTPMTLTSASTFTPYLFRIFAGNQATTTISGNSLGNMALTTASTSTTLNTAIGAHSGQVVINNNTIGSATAAGSITFTGGAASAFTGMTIGAGASATSNYVNATNNTIAGINVTGASSNAFYGIFYTTATTLSTASAITGNIIGTSTAPINNSTGGNIYVINQYNTIGATISGNTITNINNTNTSTSCQIIGINQQGGSSTIGSLGSGNILSNFNSASTMTSSNSIIGIVNQSTVAPLSIGYNTISGFTNSANAAVTISGIYNAGPTTGTNTIKNNLIHSLSHSTVALTTGVVNGIYMASGSTSVQNNLVRLGTTNAATASLIYGINDVSGTNGYYYNSVYIGGSSVGTGAINTYAFRSANTGTRAIQNNLFVNARSNATTGGKHYAITVAGSTAAPTGLTISNNDYFVSGTGGVLGLYNGADVTTIANWKATPYTSGKGPGLDALSVSGNPNFNGATSATPDLTIDATPISYIESQGTTISGITTDYAGNTRNANTPDMGAYEFTGVSAIPIINSVSSDPNNCAAVSHAVTASITALGSALTSVQISYSYNGTAQTPITMTLSASNAGTFTYNGTIPAATPTNATVAWSVVVNDGSFTVTKAGTSYSDAPNAGTTITASASVNPVCTGGSSTLSSSISPAYVNINEGFDGAAFPPTGWTISNAGSGNNWVAGTNVPCTGTKALEYVYNSSNAANAWIFTPVINAVSGQVYNISFKYKTGGGYVEALKVTYGTSATSLAQTNVIWTNSSITTTTCTTVTTTFTAPTTGTYYVGFNCFSISNQFYMGVDDISITAGINPASFTYSWSDGSSVVSTATSFSTPINTTKTYTVTATNNNCPITSSITVTATPLPASPTVNASSICGMGVPSLTATTGGQNGTFRWYAAATGGSPIATGASPVFSSINTTTTYYVSEDAGTTGSCESNRTAVTVTVTQPDAIDAIANINTICLNGVVNLSVSNTVSTPTQNYTFSWVALTTAGSGMPSSVSGATTAITPTAAGTYSYVATGIDGVCTIKDTITVLVNPLPSTPIVTASATTVCAGAAVNLAASIPGTVIIGTATTLTTATGNPTAFNNRNAQYKIQTIYTAAELAAAGLGAGNITSIAYNVNSLGDAATNSGFTVKIGNESGSSFANTSFLSNTSYTTVYGPATFTHTASGWQTINFTTPFVWNGTSNIVIDVAYTGANLSNNAITYFTATSDNKTLHSANINPPTGTLTTSRMNITFGGQTYNNASFSSTWTPGSLTGATQIVNPTSTTTYVATITNVATGCIKSNSVIVNVNPLPTAPETSNSIQCGIGIPSCFAAGTTNGNYRWYTQATGGTPIAGEVNSTLSTYSVSATTTLYVVNYNGTCESERVPVTVTVNNSDPVTAAADDTSVCANTLVSLTATQDGASNTYVFTWTASTSVGSGMSAAVVGNSVSVTPTSAGDYVYTLTAVDNAAGCTIIKTVNVHVDSLPTVSSVTATPASFCIGGSSSLSVTSNYFGNGPATSPTYVAPPAVTNPTTDEDISNVTITSGASTILNNTTARSSLVGTIGTAIGTVGSYSNFTAFGPYNVIAGQGYNFSLSSVQQGTRVYGNSMAIYIDYNRDGDFADAGEAVYVATSTISGTHTETGTFTIPSSAGAGVTRMRVICYEGLITGPTMTLDYGEFEEYSLRITSNGNLNPAYAYSWNPGNLSGSTATVTPLVTTTYTASVTNVTTGCSNSGTVLVTVNQLPPAVTVSGSEQCGDGIAAASVTSNSGAASPIFNWYAAASGGTALQTGTSNTYLSSISETTSFFISETSASGCEGSRTEVVATVNQPDAIQIITSATSICLGSSFDINSTYSPSNNLYDTYNLTVSPSTGSGLSGSTSLNVNGFDTDPYTVTPTVVGTYVYTISAIDNSFGCSTSADVTITVNANPVIDSVKANFSTVCSGSAVILNAYSSKISSGSQTLPTGYCAAANTSLSSTACIGPVSFNTLSRTSTCESGFYIDIPAATTTTTVTAGQSYTFSISTIADGTNSFAITSVWMDWNRNGVFDASEWYQPYTSGVSGTISITVPINATAGLTKMRVRSRGSSNFNGSTDACTSFGSGETEDYTINVLGRFLADPTSTYTWNPGALNGSSVTINPTTSESYTCTVTNAAGCSSTSSAIAITVNPVPVAPSVSNATQCGPGVPTCSAAASVGGTLKWYSAATGGTLLQNGGTTYNTSVSTTTSFYVSETSAAGCTGPRSQVTVTVTQPDPIVASSNGPICLNGTLNLTATVSANTNNNNYTLSWAAGAGSGITGTVSGGTAAFNSPATISVVPTQSGSYTYTVTGTDASGVNTCIVSSNVVVVVNTNPTISSITSSTSAICNGGSATLTAATLSSTTTNVTLGAGAITGSSYDAIFDHFYGGNKAQYIVRASELTALGLSAGNINSLKINMSTVASATYGGFAVSIGATAQTVMTTTLISTGLNQVYTNANYTPTTGSNTFTFTTPFNWNGTSNIVIQFCWSNNNSGGTDNFAKVDATSFVSCGFYRADTQTPAAICGGTSASGTSSNRPQFVFNGQTLTNLTANNNWTWTPGNLTGSSVSVSPTTTTSYKVTATNPTTGCSTLSNDSLTITVNEIPSAPDVTNSIQCGNAVPTCSVTTNVIGGTFKWYSAATGGTLLQTGGSTYTSSISTTTNFYVSVVSAAGCEGPRANVLATVTNPDPITASSNGPICLNGTLNLTATVTSNTNNNNYTLSWAAAAGSGITGTVSGGSATFGSAATTSVIPTANGTYTYTVTAIDASGANTCTTSGSIIVVVNANPVISSLSTAAPIICEGASTNLVATSAGNTTGSFNWTWTPGNLSGSTVVVSPTTTTSYRVRATNPTTGCSTLSTDSLTITVAPVSASAAANPSTPICIGTSVSLSANAIGQSPFIYSWSNGSSVVSTASSFTVSPTTTTTYTVTVRDACSNPTTSSVTVTVNQKPVASIDQTGTINICTPATQTLNATSDILGSTFQWTLNGANINGATNASYTVTASGSYAVIATSLASCIGVSSASTTVNINPVPSVVTITPNPASVAYGSSVGLTAATNTVVPLSENFDNNAPTWTITNGGSSPAGANWSFNSSPMTYVAGAQSFTNFSTVQGGKFIGAFSSAATGTASTIIASPVFSTQNLSSANLLFEHVYRRKNNLTDVTLVEISTNGGSTWSTLATYGAGNNLGTITADAQATTPVTISLASYLNQTNLKLRFNYTSANGNYWIVDNVRVNGVTNETFTWSPSTALSASTGSSITASPITTTTYTAIATNTYGCTSTATDVVVTVRPTAVISGTTNVCVNNTNATLSIAVAGNGPWSGTLSDGTSFSGSSSPITVNVTPSATTTYNVATLTDAIASSIAADLTGSATITIQQLPTADITNNTGATVLTCGRTAISVTATGGATYSWDNGLGSAAGASITAPGTYTVTVASSFSCTSTTSIIVTQDLTTSSSTTPVTACDSYNWNGTIYNASGTYTYLSTNSIGCDSAAIVELTINSSTHNSESQIACESYTWNGTTYTTSGNYTYNYTNSSGCASVDTLHLTINYGTHNSETQTACDSYTWNGTAYTTSGDYTHSYNNGSGCASVDTLHLTINYGSHNTETQSACNTFTWYGTAYTTSGIYTYSYINGISCPSVDTLYLTIRVSTSSSNPVFVCPSQVPYSWNGGSYSTSGTYSYSTTNAAGCDSLATLVLTVGASIPNPVASVTQPTCATAIGTITVTSPVGGLQYSIGGSYQSSTTFSGVAAGTYSLTAQNVSGCYSASTSVTVNPQPIVPGVTTVIGQINVCNVVGTNTAVSYTASALGATTYTWTLPPNTVLVSGQGTGTISVQFLSGFTAQSYKQIRVVASSICGSNLSKTYQLTAQYPTTPRTIVASTSNVCPSIGTNVPITYRVPKVFGAASYVWSSTSTAVTISHPNGLGENDTLITVTFASNFTTSSITVQTTNDCGTSAIRSLLVSRNNPTPPGLISGPTNACQFSGPNGINAVYSLNAVSTVDTYTWTLPSGATDVSGQGTNTISFRYPAGYTGGSISVTAANGCGTSAARTLNVSRLLPSTPGNIDVINTSGCPNREYSYSIAVMPSNTVSLEWSVPNGGQIVSGQGTRTIVVSYSSGVVDGQVSVRGISNCGASTYKNSIVKLAPCPAGPTAPVTKGLPIAASNPMEVKVFPNPTTSNFNLQVITADQQEVVVRIMDVQGRFIKSVKVAPYQTLSIGSELKSGSYMLEVRQGNNMKTTRVVKY